VNIWSRFYLNNFIIVLILKVTSANATLDDAVSAFLDKFLLY